MRIVELPSEHSVPRQAPSSSRRVYKVTEAVYKGPPDSFPYDAFRGLGIAQLVFGSLLCLIGLVQTAISYEDRAVSLVSGAVVIWCPLFAIAAGVVGMLFSRKRYWEAECMKAGFIVASSLAALLMLVMISVVIFVQFYYYDVINLKPVDTFKWLAKDDVAQDDGYKAMVILIVVLGAFEFIVALISASMGCCFAEIYEPDSKLEKRSTKSQSKTRLYDQPIAAQQPGPEESLYGRRSDVQYGKQQQRASFVQQPAAHFVQEPTMQFVQEPVYQFVQEPVQYVTHPPPLQFVNPQVMTPPQSLLYVV